MRLWLKASSQNRRLAYLPEPFVDRGELWPQPSHRRTQPANLGLAQHFWVDLREFSVVWLAAGDKPSP